MAKKPDDKVKTDDIDNLDDFTWPDFDEAFDAEAGDKETKGRKPITRMASTAAKEAGKYVINPDNIQRSIKKIAPGAYGGAADIGFQAMGAGKDLYNASRDEVTKTKRDLQKSLRATLPGFKDKLPDGAFKFLEKLGGTADYEYGADDAEAARTADISGKIDELFTLQAQDQQEKDKRAEAEKLIAKAVAKKQFTSTIQALTSIDQSLQLQRAYDNNIGARVQRKMLDLQYRTTYLLADMLQGQGETATAQMEQLKAIVHNTALPEAQKITKSEEFSRQNSQRLLNKMGEGLFGETSDYMGKLFKGVSGRAKESLANTLRKVRNGANDAAGMANTMGQMDGGSSEETIISMIVGMGGDWASDKLGDKYKDAIAGHQGLNKFQNQVGYGVQNAGRLLNARGQQRSNDLGAKARIGDFFNGLLHTKKLDGNLDDKLDEQGHMPDNFNRMTNRSLIDIIPGLLARIHQSSERHRLGTEDVSLIRYDMQTGSFTDSKALMSRVRDRISTKEGGAENNKDLDALVKEMGGKDLKPKQREALKKHLVQLNMRQLALDPSAMVKHGQIFGGADSKTQDALKQHMRKQYNLNEDGTKVLGDADSMGKLKGHAGKLNGMGKRMMDPTMLVKDIMASGNREELVQLGIIDLSSGTPQLNYDRVVEMYLGGGYDSANGQGGGHPPANGPTPALPPGSGGRGKGGKLPNPFPPGGGQPPPGQGAAGIAAIDYDRMGQIMADAVAGVKVKTKTKVKVAGGAPGMAGTQEEWLEAIHSAITKNNAQELLEYQGMALEEIIDVLQDGRQWTNVVGGSGGGPGGGGGADPGPQGKWDKRMARLQGGLKTGLGKLRGAAGRLPGLVSGAGGLVGGALSGAKDWYAGKKDIVTDIYVKGFNWPALEARKLQMGEYIDAATGNVITKLSDIKGDVKDRAGNIVLRLQDVEKGLRDGNGKAVVLDGIKNAKELIAKGLAFASEKAGALTGGLMGKVKKITDWAYERTQKLSDIYVKGEMQPRLMKHLLEAGAYRDKVTGKVITKLSDIKGDIEDLQGNVVLSMKDMQQGLVDRWGQPVREGFLKTLDYAKGKFNTIRGIASEQYGKLRTKASAMLDTAKGMFGRGKKKLGEKMAGIQRGIGDGIQGMSDMGIGRAQLDVQQQILDAINDLNPRRRKKIKGDVDGDGVREGSWQDILAKRKKGGGKEGAEGPELGHEVSPDGWKGMGDKLSSAKKKIMGLLGMGGDDEDDDSGPDIDDLDRRGRRGRRPGRLRRAGSRLKAGRMGRMAGSLGRGALALGGTAASSIGGTALAGTVANGAIAAGTAVAGGASTALAATGSALAAIGSLISLPVILAVGAVVAVGVAGYYAYKWYDESKDRPLQKLRFTQYGWDGNDKDQAKKMAAFEGVILKGVKSGANGATIESSADDIKDALEIFDLKAEQQDNNMAAFSAWFQRRFKPIFLGWVNSLNGIAKEISLTDIDDKLKPDQKLKLFNEVKSGAGVDAAYGEVLGPFGPDVPMLINRAKIDAVVAEVGEKINKEVAESPNSNTVTGADGKTYQAMPLGEGAAALAANEAAAPGGGTSKDPGMGSTLAKAAMIAGGGISGIMGAVGGALIQSANASENDPSKRAAGLIPTSKLDALRAIRFRTYGLTMLDRNWVRAMIELEEAVWDDTKVNAGSATWSGDLEKLTDKYAAYFALDVPGGPEWNNFQSWFKARFLPTYLAFAGAVQATDPSATPGRAHEKMDYDQQYSVAMALIGAMGEYKGSRVSVWSIPLAPNTSLPPNTERRSIQDNLDALKNGQTQKRLDEEAGKPGGTKDGRMADKPGFFSGVADAASDTWGSVKSFFGMGDDKKKETAQPYGQGPASTQPRAPGGGGGSAGGGDPYSGGAGGMEVIIDHPGGGDKGDVNSLPFPKGNKGFEAHKELIAAVAKMTGMDPVLLTGLIATESGFNSAAKPGTSAAQGLGQFIPGTWKTMMKKYGAAYGLAPGTPATDPRANALMTALFIRDNAKEIQPALPSGRKVNATDLYMAHFLGAGGYRTFLKNPGVPAASIPGMGKAATANASIFFDGGRARTTDEIVQLMNGRLGKNMELYGGKMTEFAGSYKPSADAKTPEATESNTSVQGVEAADDTAGKATPGMEAAGAGPSTGAPAPTPAPVASGPDTSASAPPAPPPPPSGPSGLSGMPSNPESQATQANAQADAAKAAHTENMGALAEIGERQVTALNGISGKLDELIQFLQKSAQGTPAANGGPAPRQTQAEMPKGPMDFTKKRA